MSYKRYWINKIKHEFGYNVKRIRIPFNIFDCWGMLEPCYVLWFYNSHALIEVDEHIFHSYEEIYEYLCKKANNERQKKIKPKKGRR